MKTIGEDKSVTSEYILTSLESLMEKQEASLRQLNEYNVILTNQYNQKVEQKFVLEKASPFFNNEAVLSAVNDIPTAPVDASSVLEKGADNIRFGYITGVLKQENQPQFERMLFRATRGNCLVRFADVETPLANAETGGDERLAVFIVFYRSSLIQNKVRKIIEAFNGHSYSLADFTSAESIRAAYSQVMIELEDAERVLNLNIDKCEALLKEVAKYALAWEWTIKKEKAVYDVFNKFKPVASGNMYGEGWVLSEELDRVRSVIEEVHRGKESNGYLEVMAKPWPKPPTHFHTNEFTLNTQAVVDTYGVPSYKECNPAVFTLVTFPFQFGIMFGDLGHGASSVLL